MDDTKILDELQSLIECGSTRITYNDDDEELEDDWGNIPIGFSIRIRACFECDVSAQSLREAVKKAVKQNDMWINDEIEELEEE